MLDVGYVASIVASMFTLVPNLCSAASSRFDDDGHQNTSWQSKRYFEG
jgi:hypothetical protein